MKTFDAIIIGTGQAGPALAGRLSASGRTVAVVERGAFGGTCVNTGCTPTKTLVASARVAHQARRAAVYGVSNGPVSVDMPAVKARKDALVERSRSGVEDSLRSNEKVTVYEGHARFTGPREVDVGGERLSAEWIFVDVGARAAVPDMPGVDDVPFLTNSSILDLDVVPEHLVVVGGSYIGLEFAQMFRRFGSRVTVVEKGVRLIGREDAEVSDAVREILEGEGIAVRCEAECISLAKNGDGVAVSLDCESGAREAQGSHLLLAVGRKPNTDDLGLEVAGIETDERGHIIVDEKLATTVEGVWALGDCNGRGAFTHTAYNDHEIVAHNLLAGGDRKVSDRIQAYCLYIDPPLGRCGMTEREAREAGRKVRVSTRPMEEVARAREKGETAGFMKIVVDAGTRKILGASLLGTGCDEVIHSVLDVMYAGAPYDLLRRAMHIHPTVSELIPTMLGEMEGG